MIPEPAPQALVLHTDAASSARCRRISSAGWTDDGPLGRPVGSGDVAPDRLDPVMLALRAGSRGAGSGVTGGNPRPPGPSGASPRRGRAPRGGGPAGGGAAPP